MIAWLVQRAADDPRVAAGTPPEGLLSVEESAVFGRLHSEKRRQDWLLGRWTAKSLIQATVEKSGSPRCPSSEISILAAEDGAPEMWLAEPDGLRRGDFTVSISHSHGVSLCAAIPGNGHQLGADIEFIESRSDRFAADNFSEIEQRTVQGTASEKRDCLVTAIWSGKEAALKAVREGLRFDTRGVSCIFASPFEIAHDWQLFSVQWQHSGYPQHQGWWRVWDNFVLTLVVGRDLQQP